MDGCKKRFSSTDAKRRHIRRAHGWKDYQRASYWTNVQGMHQGRCKGWAIKLPPEERKRRVQARRDEEREQRRQQGAGTFKSGRGGRPPKPIRSGRPSAEGALKARLLRATEEPNVRQFTRALMKLHESDKATPVSSKTMPKRSVGKISAKERHAADRAVGSTPSSGKATATISTMAQFKEMMAYLKQRKAMKK